MKQIITATAAAAALVWFTLAAPSEATAFTLGAQGSQIEITIGASQFNWFGGQPHRNNRQPFNRRHFNHKSPGFGHNGPGFQIWGYRGGGYHGGHSFGGGHPGPGFQNFGYQGRGYRLPAHVIIRSLRARSFRHISTPRFSRGLYHARARDAHGRWVRLAIDPYSGHIVRLLYRF